MPKPDTDTPTPELSETLRRFIRLRDQLRGEIIGQEHLVDSLLIGLLADGHLLVEGAPGLAKTTAIKALAERFEGDFHRMQFTPDLLPGDLTGTEVYRPQSGEFVFQKGPVFHNLILADEVNRAPAKVQSALLEAMGERQVTVGMTTYRLPEPFLVMATQNPIEQEGTYPLPEAQLDRFLMHVSVGYPDATAERRILQLVREQARNRMAAPEAPGVLLHCDDVRNGRLGVLDIFMSDAVEEYIVQLVLATRDPAAYDGKLARWIAYGASPRGTLSLDRCARAHAWLVGRDYVSPEDVHAVVHDVLRHRLILSFEAEAEGISPDAYITELLRRVPAV